ISLAENRLKDQETTFMTLESNIEDADSTEVAVQLSSAEVSYEAALMATGKVSQNSLLNYI
ncbi:MAG: flagellar hook-associated protein 3, partial [Lachnospiraceae bacterium]|nr:flagellar hook-associated protein 3 [Lachnospiraceae bacterium]